MTKFSHATPVVIDNGTGLLKAGFAGDTCPRLIIPTVIGLVHSEEGGQDFLVGREAFLSKGARMVHPIRRGVVVDWDAMIRLWDFVFRRGLKIDPSKHPVLLTEPVKNPEKNRERIFEIMFEVFNVPSLCMMPQVSLSLRAVGADTGIVVESGEGLTQITPIYKGYCIDPAVMKIELGGTDVSEHLMRLLIRQGYNISGTKGRLMVQEIKEKYCYVAVRPDMELKLIRLCHKSVEVVHSTSDGAEIALSQERFMAPEVMFDPSLIGKDLPGVHEALIESILSCDITIRGELISRIILSGGNTMFPGFKERIEREVERDLKARGMKDVGVEVLAVPERNILAWVGGSVVASSSNFIKMCVTRKQYQLGITISKS